MKEIQLWTKEVKKYSKPLDLIEQCGIYNDFWFWMNLNLKQKKTLSEILNKFGAIDDIWERKKQPHYYDKSKFKDQKNYSSKGNQFLFSFEYQTFDLSESSLEFNEIEKNTKLNTQMQLYLTGNFFAAKNGLIYLINNFIIPEKIPTLAMGPNCINPIFRGKNCAIFSANINPNF